MQWVGSRYSHLSGKFLKRKNAGMKGLNPIASTKRPKYLCDAQLYFIMLGIAKLKNFLNGSGAGLTPTQADKMSVEVRRVLILIMDDDVEVKRLYDEVRAEVMFDIDRLVYPLHQKEFEILFSGHF